MKCLIRFLMPNEPFNGYAREGTAGKKLSRILEETGPESVYFTEMEGKRCAVTVYDLDDSSKLPSITEPWFLTFNAECRVGVAMSQDDLKRAGLEDLGKKWRG